jgi:galactoside O-acetyltransferase
MCIINRLKQYLFVRVRIKKYRLLSNCKKISGKPVLFHPLLMRGKGKISFGENVQIGVVASPKYYSHYSFLDAREENSEISFGNNVAISNSFSIECCSKVAIEDNVLIGDSCSIMDNDGHNLELDKRDSGFIKGEEVRICKNVFLGSNVIVLKGVIIGENSVIGSGSIVTKNIPENVIAAGNPAKVIRNL